jgi:hypothetical protein
MQRNNAYEYDDNVKLHGPSIFLSIISLVFTTKLSCSIDKKKIMTTSYSSLDCCWLSSNLINWGWTKNGQEETKLAKINSKIHESRKMILKNRGYVNVNISKGSPSEAIMASGTPQLLASFKGMIGF